MKVIRATDGTILVECKELYEKLKERHDENAEVRIQGKRHAYYSKAFRLEMDGVSVLVVPQLSNICAEQFLQGLFQLK